MDPEFCWIWRCAPSLYIAYAPSTPELTLFFFLFPTNLPLGLCPISIINLFPLPSIPRPAHITMSKTFSKDDVASHSKGDSLWIVIDEDVYDVTKFQDEHPGKSFL